ncbi:MAG: FAD:protein FMN transferase [Actinomycetota bacterium]|nr:FAD:protein FMN transferase [Actinomycetota bacterium]
MTTKHLEHVMGTVFSIHVLDEGDWKAAIAEVVADLHWVDETFSTYRSDSEISRLGRGEVRLRDCSSAVTEVLGLCADVQAATDGYYAATMRGVLDPSGLVKGWAIARASATLNAAGASSHAVNGGGDMQVVGFRSGGRLWRVGISHPLEPGCLATVVEGRDLAVATSGVAERGCHIIDPRTGRPPHGLASITVTGPGITLVDAYATAGYAMGPASRQWLEELEGYEAFAVAEDGSAWATAGFPTAASLV